MSHKSKDEFLETEDLREWINEYSRRLILNITKDNKNRKAKITIIGLDDIKSYKSYIELIVMLINDMGALETIYNNTTNTIELWYD